MESSLEYLKQQYEKNKLLQEDEYYFQIFIENTVKQRKIVDGYIRIIGINILWTIIPLPIIELCYKYQFTKQRNQPLLYIGEIILNGNWKMEKVKTKILQTFKQIPSPMRLREFSFDSILEREFFDDVDLQTNCKRICGGIRNGSQICCEKINVEQYLTKQNVIINVAKCVFGKKDIIIYPFNCIVMNKLNKPLNDFKKYMEYIEHIEWGKLYFKFMRPKKFYQIDEESNVYLRKKELLSQYVWKPASFYNRLEGGTRTGDILLYTDDFPFHKT
eukprot:474343_1